MKDALPLENRQVHDVVPIELQNVEHYCLVVRAGLLLTELEGYLQAVTIQLHHLCVQYHLG